MRSQFIEQVQILMQAQQIKCAENVFGKSNYMWLSNKKITLLWLSTKDEFLIRQGLSKLNQEQQVKVMKELLTWLDEHPNVETLKIPQMCIYLLNRKDTQNIMQQVTISRMSNFRNSLRRFSSMSNKVSWYNSKTDTESKTRSVTFNEVATVYTLQHN